MKPTACLINVSRGTSHIATESVKLSDAVVDFWCENLRRFAENQPLLGVVDRRARTLSALGVDTWVVLAHRMSGPTLRPAVPRESGTRS